MRISAGQLSDVSENEVGKETAVRVLKLIGELSEDDGVETAVREIVG